MNVKLETMFNLLVLITVLVITLVAIIGKVIFDLGDSTVKKFLVGFEMVTRRKVGLILLLWVEALI